MADEQPYEKMRRKFQALGETTFNMVSDSMAPLIPPDTLVTAQVVRKKLRRFDIVVFWEKSESQLVCHYVWHINTLPSLADAQIIVTRALQRRADFPLAENQLLGVVVSHRLSKAMRLRITLRNLWAHS